MIKLKGHLVDYACNENLFLYHALEQHVLRLKLGKVLLFSAYA
jgi:hypothetical protein